MDKPKKSVRRKTSGVTIDEVAALAGVSPMTVSRAVNQGNVREETRDRVMRAVRKLDAAFSGVSRAVGGDFIESV